MREVQLSLFQELVIDNFAGGGGASIGISNAIGRSVDIAINHDPAAIAMHKANHPGTLHYCESVWEINPREVTKGQQVALVWLSPDCKHFSKAKGSKPVEKSIRGLAWVALRWAATVRPRVIMLENVEEFLTWGPLIKSADGKMRPDPKQKGREFKCFVNALKYQGYKVDWRELRACDYGAPTSRKRLFLVARCDGRPIAWPEPTHGDPKSAAVKSGKLKPWRTAAEIIDWSLPCPSIFDTADEIKFKYGLKAIRPLADNTMRRIAKGADKFVLHNAEPFILQAYGDNYTGVKSNIQKLLPAVSVKDNNFVGIPFLSQYHSFVGDGARGQTLDRPLLTIDTNPRYALTAAFFTKYYSTSKNGSSIKDPLHTVTSKDRVGLVETHLCVFQNNMACKDVREPMPTIMTSAGHFAEVRTILAKITENQNLGHWTEVRKMLNQYCNYTLAADEIILMQINGELYFISDIGMRMLIPRELFNGNGFPPDYIIDRDYEGKSYPKSAQVTRCGNAVPPPFAEAIVRANMPEICVIAA